MQVFKNEKKEIFGNIQIWKYISYYEEWGVYLFIGDELIMSQYFETEEEAEKKFLLVCEKMKRVI